MVQNMMQQSKELEARKMHAGEKSMSSVPRNPEVTNQVINLDSQHLTGPIQAGSLPLVQSNVAFTFTWQASQPNTASAGSFNTIQSIGVQFGLVLRPLVANMNYMPTSVSNPFATTLGEQANKMIILTKIFLHR